MVLHHYLIYNFLHLIQTPSHLCFKCDENEISFKDISKKMMLTDGSTDTKYIMDDIHLSQQAMPLLQEEFNDII